jgi:hypothetical protein
MKNDFHKLEMLYEATIKNRTDALLLENFDTEKDWDFLWSRFTVCFNACYQLYESLQVTSSKQEQDVYDLTISDDLQFKIAINFIDKQKLDDRIISGAAYADSEEQFQKLKQAIANTPHPVMHIYFEDKTGNVNLTTLVKNFTFAVFGGVKDAILKSIATRAETRPDIVFVDISKNEPKRLRIYKKFFGPALGWFEKELHINSPYERYETVWFWRKEVENKN